MATAATPDPIIRQIVDAMRALAGPYPGFRPVHAKGLVCPGTFRAAPEASRITRAPHFSGPPVPTVVRFANANGNPDVHDGAPNVRSMAVKFQLPDGKSADVLANSVEGFIARTPAELLEFLSAQLPAAGSRPDPEAVPRFLAAHPAGRAFVARLMKRPVPASYAQATYYADDASKRDSSFLRQELETRLRNGPVAFRLLLQVAEAGDPTDDVTALWPDSRLLAELGRLEITAISPSSATDEKRLIFDPSNRTEGIDLSADPILNARSAAYSISYDRRNKGE